MLAMFAGAAMFLLDLRLPEIPFMAVHAVGVMIGPMSMIITGIAFQQDKTGRRYIQGKPEKGGYQQK